jgi:hypothetical protein
MARRAADVHKADAADLTGCSPRATVGGVDG